MILDNEHQEKLHIWYQTIVKPGYFDDDIVCLLVYDGSTHEDRVDLKKMSRKERFRFEKQLDDNIKKASALFEQAKEMRSRCASSREIVENLKSLEMETDCPVLKILQGKGEVINALGLVQKNGSNAFDHCCDNGIIYLVCWKEA